MSSAKSLRRRSARCGAPRRQLPLHQTCERDQHAQYISHRALAQGACAGEVARLHAYEKVPARASKTSFFARAEIAQVV